MTRTTGTECCSFFVRFSVSLLVSVLEAPGASVNGAVPWQLFAEDQGGVWMSDAWIEEISGEADSGSLSWTAANSTRGSRISRSISGAER